jgi:hypothetical protein
VVPNSAPETARPQKFGRLVARYVGIRVIAVLVLGVVVWAVWTAADLPHPWVAGLYAVALGGGIWAARCSWLELRVLIRRWREQARMVHSMSPVAALAAQVWAACITIVALVFAGLVPPVVAYLERRRARAAQGRDTQEAEQLRRAVADLNSRLAKLERTTSEDRDRSSREIASLHVELEATDTRLDETEEQLGLATGAEIMPERVIASWVLGLLSLASTWLGSFLWLANVG